MIGWRFGIQQKNHSHEALKMDWTSILKSVAPTVATALLGPLGGAAVSAVGSALGVAEPTQKRIADVIASANMTPEQISALKALELQYQNDERERGFRYAELSFSDRDSARKNNVAGGVQKYLFWLSLILLGVTLGSEVSVLFYGYPQTIPEIIVGRILGLMDAVAMMVLSYWYGTTQGSAQKTELLAAAQPVR
jgi:hypothetical protein